MIDPIKFEEYKLFIDDTARFTERRQNASNLYITVNSLLLAAIAFTMKDMGTDGTWVMVFPIPVIVAGIFISLWWQQLIKKYKKLVGLRLRILRQMEEAEELSGLEKMYHAEDELYPTHPDGTPRKGEGLNFSDLEGRLPTLFIVLYGVSLVLVTFSLANHLISP